MDLYNLNEYLNIPYIKLHFTAKVLENCVLPANKASGLRGGTGQMMILQNCILHDRKCSAKDCEECGCADECLVQRFLYTPMSIKPSFSCEKISMGYLFECENYKRNFKAEETFNFQVTLFGKSRVYLNLLLQAIYALGQTGLGKNACKFNITGITNSKKEAILIDGPFGGQIDKSKCQSETLASYVDYRLKQLRSANMTNTIKFQTETSIVYQKELIKEFSFNPILSSMMRRIYLFNCFEGHEIDLENYCNSAEKALEESAPDIIFEKSEPVFVRRFSSRQRESMYLNGIKGEMQLDIIPDALLPTLIAGEITHVGKNTSFGFGRYRVM